MVYTARAKLFTREDSVLGVPHVHKTLGLGALCCVILALFQPARFWPTSDGTGLLPWALLLHVTLSLTSFVFAVPSNSSVHVMDKLYRAQVLTFSCRSAAVIVVVLWGPRNYQYCLRYFGVVVCHLLTDLAAAKLGARPDFRGVRRPLRKGEEMGGVTVSAGRLFFSIAQLNATSQLLWVRNEQYVLIGAYYTMAVIQVTAFMMTLTRKGLLSTVAWKVVYTCMLLGTAIQVIQIVELLELLHICAVSSLFAGCRLRLGVNKYVLMTVVFLYAVMMPVE